MEQAAKTIILISDPETTKHHRIMMEEMGSIVLQPVSMQEFSEMLNVKFDLAMIDVTLENGRQAIAGYEEILKKIKLILIIDERSSGEQFQQIFDHAIIITKPISPVTLNNEVVKALSVPTRRPIKILVRLQLIDQPNLPFALGTMIDLSENGMLLETEKVLSIGNLLKFSFYLSETGGFVEVTGEITRETRASSIKMKCYGIKFTSIEKSFQEKISRFVLRMQLKKY
ncbi:MAG: hypothetical protein A2Y62_21270 [Candidatus Fischerbacteria bacterium RBG_13_37_8]|uniref:PilZ domain-containing protein n=1 Tax=Candidatus Fischerbacteria bacterium RBG_13_37_8 TaxID=1817863 RepID=A0A1F5VPZ8_9BACT|nr:MAG: hypothetical protein A2Y62_21270 [Candidatus Fischerbacteria bacterium RBG_13_37_8]